MRRDPRGFEVEGGRSARRRGVRKWWRGALLSLAVLLLAGGCGELLYEDAAAPIQPALLTLEPALGPQSVDGGQGIAAAFAQVAEVEVRLASESGEVLVDQVFPVGTQQDGEIRIQVEVEVGTEASAFDLELELRGGGSALFRHASTLNLQPGGTARPSLELDPVPAELRIEPESPQPLRSLGETVQLTGVVLFATGDPIAGMGVDWEALDPDVVSVSGTGQVTAVSEGTGRIRASHGSLSAEVSMSVEAEPVSLEVEPAEAELLVGETVQLTVSVLDAGGSPLDRAVAWTSLDSEVASVDESGLVTARSAGSVGVEARLGDLVERAEVTVVAAEPVVETVGATSITFRSARIRGNVNPSGLETRVWFEWGTDASLAEAATTSPTTLSASAGQTLVGHDLRDLSDGNIYYFRVVAENESGEARGEIRSFETRVEVPTPTDLTIFDSEGVFAEWQYDLERFPDARFELQVREADAGQEWITVAETEELYAFLEESFDAGVTYEFRVRACRQETCSPWSGVVRSTPEGFSPFVETRPSIEMAGTGVTLRAWVYDGGYEANYYFRWADNSDFVGAQTTPVRTVERTPLGEGGGGSSQTSSEASSSGPAGEAPEVGEFSEELHRVEEFLTGLQPGEPYYFQAVAENPQGSYTGMVYAFVADEEPAPVQELTLTQLGSYMALDGTFEFVGEVAPTPDFVEIERQVDRGGWSYHADFNFPSSFGFSYADFGVSGGVEYGYRVRVCFNFGGCSALSQGVFQVFEDSGFAAAAAPQPARTLYLRPERAPPLRR
jgi:hypothetical protein